MDKDQTFKLPRLFTQNVLGAQNRIELPPTQAHYLHNVMRRKAGDHIRLFNGADGEWLATIEGINKKSAVVVLAEQLLPQPTNVRRVHLVFAPIKKHRQDWLIEKAVELGATDFHPILTQNTEVRKIKEERIRQQIFEAAEQCERLEIPILHGIKKLDQFLADMPEGQSILSCIERCAQTKEIDASKGDVAILIGPEGGFTAQEKEILVQKTTPVTLGDTVLRCETAAVKALILA